MKFVAIADTHCLHRKLKLPQADVLLHAGDISCRGKKHEIKDFLDWLAGLPYRYKIFIAGNHDFFFEKTSKDEIEKMLPEGVIYLNDSGTEVGGITIWGSPITPWFYNWAFNRHRGADIRKHWNRIPAHTQILMTHGPAYGLVDCVEYERHAGCVDLLQTIQKIRPQVHLCGHIHEAYGQEKRNGTLFINACVVNEQYVLVNKPVVFDLAPAAPPTPGTLSIQGEEAGG